MPAMPRPIKPARLWLKPASAGGPATWIIKDAGRRLSTGLPASAIREAEQRLRDHLAEMHDPARSGAPGEIVVADVLNFYAKSVGASVSRPAALGGRLEALLKFFGTKTLAEINGPQCRAYAAQRSSDAAARRELEDLRAAINLHRKEGLCNAVVSVILPSKTKARERWLTRSEVARLIHAAWRFRQRERGGSEGRHVRRHVARFIVAALYSGSRSAVILESSFERLPGRGFIDLDNGVWYRLPEDSVETDKRRPTIHVPIRLLAHMRRWRANGQKHLIEFDREACQSIKKAFAQVVADADKQAAAAAAKLGVAPPPALRDVTPHVLRHTAVTWSMQAGADAWKIGGFVGMSERMIQQTYGHHHPDHHGGVGELLARAGRTVSGPFDVNKRGQTRIEVEIVSEVNQ